jgi:predicted  nucleic acid-binding Zn-ribbon protein
MFTFQCRECGKKFKTAQAAENASYNGCPKCGGCDIDVDTDPPARPRQGPCRQARAYGNSDLCGPDMLR